MTEATKDEPNTTFASLHVREVCSLKAFDSLQAEWDELLAQVPTALPFQSFAWNRSWWQHLAPPPGRWRREQLCVLTVRDPTDRLVGIWPLFCSHTGPTAHVGVKWWRPFGADPNLTELRLPLLLADFADEAMAALHLHTVKWLSAVSMVHEQLSVDVHESLLGGGVAALQTRVASPLRVLSNFVVDLGADWPTMKSGLKRNIKESIRRCYNSLARDHLKASLVVRSERADVLSALPRFYGLHRQRANAHDTVKHPNYFEPSTHRRFIAALVKQTHGDAGVRMFELWIDGKPVAARLGFVTNRELYLYYSGYNLDYGQYSVMTTLVVEAMQWAIAQRLRTVNLSVGEDVSKTRWSPRKLDYSEVLVTLDGWRGELMRKHLVSRVGARIDARRTPVPLKGREKEAAEREADTEFAPVA